MANSSASAAVAESLSLPLITPRCTACALSIRFSVTPNLFCNAVASCLLPRSISADSGPCHAPYV
eukprot:4809878-Pleurochrysis_carterae.AAC.1